MIKDILFFFHGFVFFYGFFPCSFRWNCIDDYKVSAPSGVALFSLHLFWYEDILSHFEDVGWSFRWLQGGECNSQHHLDKVLHAREGGVSSLAPQKTVCGTCKPRFMQRRSLHCLPSVPAHTSRSFMRTGRALSKRSLFVSVSNFSLHYPSATIFMLIELDLKSQNTGGKHWSLA